MSICWFSCDERHGCQCDVCLGIDWSRTPGAKMKPYMTEVTEDEAAKRLGEGEIVERNGIRYRKNPEPNLGNIIEQESELTRTWIPSAEFPTLREVWSTADGLWLANMRPGKLKILGSDVAPVGNSEHWIREIGEVLCVSIERGCVGFDASVCPIDTRDGFSGPSPIIESGRHKSANSASLWASDEVHRLLDAAVEACGGKVDWG